MYRINTLPFSDIKINKETIDFEEEQLELYKSLVKDNPKNKNIKKVQNILTRQMTDHRKELDLANGFTQLQDDAYECKPRRSRRRIELTQKYRKELDLANSPTQIQNDTYKYTAKRIKEKIRYLRNLIRRIKAVKGKTPRQLLINLKTLELEYNKRTNSTQSQTEPHTSDIRKKNKLKKRR
jgi:hypothetical protein